MIDLAYKYEEEIREKMLNTWYDEKYMFYHSSAYHTVWQNPKPEDGDWSNRHFVSLNSKKEVIGVIDYHVNIECDMATWFGAINFTDDKLSNKMEFGKDIAQVIYDIFCKFNMRQLEFSVIVGNPIERSYDRMVRKYGGQITGIKHKHVKLLDGNYYDHKDYEIFREDYIMAKETIKQNKLRKKNVEGILNEE